MKIEPVAGGLHVAPADDEVAKAFAFLAIPGVVLDHRLEQVKNLLTSYAGTVELVQSLSKKSNE